MFPIKASKFLALSTLLITVLANSTFTSAQANTLTKSTINKAGRVVTPVINTLLSGKGAPRSTIGIDGDFYIDTNKMSIYGPKTKGKWPAPVSMKGSAGTDGTNGTNGLTGATGAKGTSTTGSDGAPGLAGPSGAPGATGPAGSGSPGATGAAGVAGSNGASGSNGTNGTNGAPGSIGETGPKGENGTIGLTGPAGSNAVVAFNLTTIGGGTDWGLSSTIATFVISSPFGNLQPNTKYRFTILVTGTVNRTGFDTLPVGSVVTLSGEGATLNFATHFGRGFVSDESYANTYKFSFLHEGTVSVASAVSNLSVSVIDGGGWSAGFSTFGFGISGKAFIQIA